MRSARFATSNLVTPFIAAALSAASALACQPQEAKAPEAAASAPTESAPSESAPTTEAPAAPTDANEAEKQAARSGAETWLALVDQSQYGQSWDAAAPMFQSAVTKEQWEGAAKGARGPLGALASRKFNAADYKQSLPGAPDGEYVLVVYDTSFAQKAAATERVTLVRTPEGTWKVVGYFIQ
jgi:hypothetical protein